MNEFLVFLLALSGGVAAMATDDATQIKATALELLAALSAFAVAGKPINDNLLAYVAGGTRTNARRSDGAARQGQVAHRPLEENAPPC